MTRPTDEQVRAIAEGKFLSVEGRWILVELAQEVLEARERGTTGTVDALAANRIPTDMKDGLYVPNPEGGLTIASWTPEEGGRGRCTQVHLAFDLGHMVPGLQSVTRLKSGHGVDKLIYALHKHRCHVWPDYRGLRVRTP